MNLFLFIGGLGVEEDLKDENILGILYLVLLNESERFLEKHKADYKNNPYKLAVVALHLPELILKFEDYTDEGEMTK